MIKSVYIAFGLFLLFISVKKSRFIDIHTLSLLIFILSNRLYIDGAFNFTRSWFAMHFFAFALLSIYGEKKSTNQKFYFLILLLVALSIHFQGTIICSVLLIISYFIRLVSSKFLPQVAISILGLFSINFILSRRFYTSISSVNANLRVFGENYFSLSLIYQFFCSSINFCNYWFG